LINVANHFLNGENSMKTKLYSAIAGAALMAASGLAMAETPLTTSQMDTVTAGGFAEALANAVAVAGTFSTTLTNTTTAVTGVFYVPTQLGGIYGIGSSATAQAESFGQGLYTP
jgi:hypothetical protein